MRVAIAQPCFGPEERRAVNEVLAGGRLVQGPRVEEFEQAFAALHDAAYAVATSSGTTALLASLLAHGLGPGDEVIVPAFSFFATVSAVLSVGAKPVLVDVNPETFTIDPAHVECALSPSTRAVLAVHLYGHPARVEALSDLCRHKGLVLLQDAAQAHLSSEAGRKVGSEGTASFSFFASKNMTTGEGGMVLTTHESVFRRLRMIRNQGRNEAGEHEVLGGNYRMTEMCAAIGCVQVRSLPEWTRLRQENAKYYDEVLSSCPETREVRLPVVRAGCEHSYHQYTVLLPHQVDRDRVIEDLHNDGIEARVYYRRGMHQEPIMVRAGARARQYPVTEDLSARVLSLPVHHALSREQRELTMDRFVAAISRQ